MWYIYVIFTDNQNESLEYCFEGVWQKIPSRNRESLVIKINKLLHEAPDEILCFAWQLMSGEDVFMKLSDGIKRRYINSYFSYNDDLLEKPYLMDLLVSELQRYGLGMLEEKNHKAAAKMFLKLYFEYADMTDDELTANELEAVRLIPGLLYNSIPAFLECFRKQLQQYILVKMKSPTERKRLILFNELIEVINAKPDMEEGKKWGMIQG